LVLAQEVHGGAGDLVGGDAVSRQQHAATSASFELNSQAAGGNAGTQGGAGLAETDATSDVGDVSAEAGAGGGKSLNGGTGGDATADARATTTGDHHRASAGVSVQGGWVGGSDQDSTALGHGGAGHGSATSVALGASNSFANAFVQGGRGVTAVP